MDLQAVAVFFLGRPVFRGVAIDVNQGVVQIDLPRHEIIVVGGGSQRFAEGGEDPALIPADGSRKIAAAGICPIFLGKPAVVHGGKEDEIRLLGGVAAHELVVIQVKADGAAHPSEGEGENGRFGAVGDLAVVQFRRNQMVFVVDAKDLPVGA